MMSSRPSDHNAGLQHEYEITSDEEEQFSELFNRLDTNKDGRIDVHDLSEALKTMRVPQVEDHAKKFMRKSDLDRDGHIDFADFLHYMTEHERNLRLLFRKIDANQDGMIDKNEIVGSFRELGVHITHREAHNLLKRMDRDGSLQINWEEWREYLLLQPSSTIQDILHFWRHATIIDVGENSLVPDDFTETELQTGMWWRHLVAGAAAGAVSRTCTAPLDRLKVFLQVHASSKNNLGIMTGLRHMLHEGGVKSLWRGNGVNVLKIAPETAIKFMAYEHIKRVFKRNSAQEIGVGERFISGSLAGAISQTVIYPMEVLKTRLALRRTGQYSGIADCAAKVYQSEGIHSFYRGYVPNLIGIIPYAGIDLAIYETLKAMYMSRCDNQDPGIFVLLACGTLSSTCGQLASYPLALVRTKLQAQGSKPQRDSMTSMVRSILVEEGPRGLYRGITPNFMKVAPAVSISYAVYEHARKALGVTMT